MNPLTNVRNQNKVNQRELEMGYTGTKNSWHNKYKDSAWIFIGGLPYDLSEGDVLCIFSQYGEIVNLNLVRDKSTGKSKGFCFICYEDQRSSILAVDNFNGAKVLSRTLRVDHVESYRQPKENGEEDELTRLLREHGCAPQALPVSQKVSSEEEEVLPVPKTKKGKKKKIKKEKKKKKKKKRVQSSESSSSCSDSEENDNGPSPGRTPKPLSHMSRLDASTVGTSKAKNGDGKDKQYGGRNKGHAKDTESLSPPKKKNSHRRHKDSESLSPLRKTDSKSISSDHRDKYKEGSSRDRAKIQDTHHHRSRSRSRERGYRDKGRSRSRSRDRPIKNKSGRR